MSAYEAWRKLVEGNGDVGGSPFDVWLILLPIIGIVALVGFVLRFIAVCQGPVPDAEEKP